jgi:hypothetical protein
MPRSSEEGRGTDKPSAISLEAILINPSIKVVHSLNSLPFEGEGLGWGLDATCGSE